jgi:hypothetical protein
MKAIITYETKTILNNDSLIFVQDNYGSPITFNLKKESDVIYPIPINAQVMFKLRKFDAVLNTVDAACTISDYTSGIAIYTIGQTDLSVAGKYTAELQISSPTLVISTKLNDIVVDEKL